jgi:excisionase family DNA binding protein
MQHYPEPLTYRVADACRALSCSKGTVYSLIRSGKLESRLLGRKRLILARSLHALLGDAA